MPFMPTFGGGGGGGGGAGDVRAGGAYYEIYAKDNLGIVLDRLDAKARAFDKVIKAVGSGMATLGVGAAMVKFVEGWNEINGSAAKYRMELERSAALTDEMGKIFDRRQAADATKLAGLAGDPVAQHAEMNKQIAQLRKELDGAGRNARAARREFDALFDIEDANNWIDRIHQVHGMKVEAAKTAAMEAEKNVTRLRDAVKKLEVARNELGDPEMEVIRRKHEAGLAAGKAIRDEAEAMVRRLHDQQRFAGMNADEIALAKFEEAGVARAVDLQAIRDMMPTKMTPWMVMALNATTAATNLASGMGKQQRSSQGMFSSDWRSTAFGSEIGDQGEALNAIKKNTDDLPKKIAEALAIAFALK